MKVFKEAFRQMNPGITFLECVTLYAHDLAVCGCYLP